MPNDINSKKEGSGSSIRKNKIFVAAEIGKMSRTRQNVVKKNEVELSYEYKIPKDC